MSEDKALVPVEQREIEFYGDELTVVLVEIDNQEVVYVPVRPICDYLGLDWSAQYRRINRDRVLSEELAPCVVVTATQGQPDQRREMLCLPLRFINGFLFGINANRIKKELQEPVVRYQRECYEALAVAFLDRAAETAMTPTMQNLVQIEQMGLAIAKMAREQIEHEKRITHVEDRLDAAREYVAGMNRRLIQIERRVSPGRRISDEQASEIKEKVKALALLLTDQGKGDNQFQSVFGTIHRRFLVSSYKEIPQEKFAAIVAFLDEWTTAAQQEDE